LRAIIWLVGNRVLAHLGCVPEIAHVWSVSPFGVYWI